jgi:DNA-binding SARP family transcriptional activator
MLFIRLFGTPALVHDGTVVLATCRKGWCVLAMLAAAGNPVPRGRIAGELWPEHDEAHARRALATTLWRLGKSAPEPVVETAGDVLRLAPRVRCDLAEFRALLVADHAGDPTAALESAVALQSADLLPDEDSAWCSLEREALRALMVEALDRLLAIHEDCGDHRRALAVGKRLVQAEPYMEHAHRAVIRAYGALGERVAAARQFQRCADLLRRELDVAPMPETVAALREAAGSGAAAGETGAWPASAALDRLRRHLDGARRALDEMSRA